MTDQNLERVVAALRAAHAEPPPEFIASLRLQLRDEATSGTDSPTVRPQDPGANEQLGDDPTLVDLRPANDLRQPVKSAAPAHQKRRAVVAVAVAAALLLVVGIVVADRNNDSEVISSVVDSDAGYQWSRVIGGEAVFGGERNQVMNSVTAGGPGLVAVGSDGVLSGSVGGLEPDSVAAVWTSVDGIIWSRVPHDEEVFGNASMRDVTVGGPGLVAVGWSPNGDSTVWDGSSDAAVWTSVDGITWSRVHDADFSAASTPEAPGNAMDSVVVGGPGLVAVGNEGGAAAAWTSVDGTVWSRVPHETAVFGSPTALGHGMNSVTAGGPGLVAVGALGEQPTIDAMVWTSVDGVTWTRVEVLGGPDDQIPWSVTAGGPGLVAVGEDNSIAAAWTSVDGIDWVQVPGDDEVFGPTDGSDVPAQSSQRDHAMNEVIAVEKGLVAVGGPSAVTHVPTLGWGSSDGDLVAAAWTSLDGITWSRVPHDAAVFGRTGAHDMWSVTTAGSNLVAVGSHRPSSDADIDAAVWLAATGN